MLSILHRTLMVTLFVAASGCASLDSAGDRRDVRATVAARLGNDLPELPEGPDEAGAIADEVARLLAEPLTEDSAVRLALLNNHAVRATYERLGIARADLVQAGLLRNPAFDLDVRFLDGGGTDMEFGLSQPILELFFLPLRQRLAEHEFEAVKLRITDELVRLIFAVRRAHLDAVTAEQLVKVHREDLAAALAAHELQVELHAAGNSTDRNLAADRVAESQARLDLAAAELAAIEAREPLQALLGLFGENTSWQLAEGLADDPLRGIDLERVETRAVANSLDLTAHRAGLDALAQRAGLDSWRGWFPELVLGPNGIRVPGGTYGFGPRLEGELPLFDSGSTRRARSTAALRAGMHDHVQLAVEVRSAARLLRERTALLAERVRYLREQHLPHRQQVVRTTLQVYNAMQIGAFEVLEQKQLEIDDQRHYTVTLRDAHEATLQLMQLLAGSMPENAISHDRHRNDGGGLK